VHIIVSQVFLQVTVYKSLYFNNALLKLLIVCNVVVGSDGRVEYVSSEKGVSSASNR